MNDVKVYVGVYSTFDPEGRMFPRKIVWEDGTEYEIDKILDIRQAAALKAGSGGDRYTVMINGKQTYLFYERCAELFSDEGYAGDASGVIGRWFVERR